MRLGKHQRHHNKDPCMRQSGHQGEREKRQYYLSTLLEEQSPPSLCVPFHTPEESWPQQSYHGQPTNPSEEWAACSVRKLLSSHPILPQKKMLFFYDFLFACHPRRPAIPTFPYRQVPRPKGGTVNVKVGMAGQMSRSEISVFVLSQGLPLSDSKKPVAVAAGCTPYRPPGKG